VRARLALEHPDQVPVEPPPGSPRASARSAGSPTAPAAEDAPRLFS
jgi:hypothetical protein